MVPGDQYEIVFQSERGNPQVVIGNRRTCPLELNEKVGIVFRGPTAGQQQANRRFGQESP